MISELDARDRASIVGDLESEDAELRRLAVERSGALPRDEAIRLLVDRLGDAELARAQGGGRAPGGLPRLGRTRRPP